jgi:hypothetical protein
VSSISRSHSPCQEGAVGTDPSMRDISYIDVKTRKTSPHMRMHTRDPDGIRTVHTAHVRTHDSAIVTPPPDIAPRLGEHGGSTVANSHMRAHTSSESSEFVHGQYAPTGCQGSRVQCAGDCTSGIRFGRAAPPHWFGSVQQRLCAAHARAYQMLGRYAPLTGLGSVVLPAASVCGTRVCSRVCVYMYMPRCPSASNKCGGSV